MKKDLTEMVFILDRSGSMQSLTSDTIGGFNSMIESQKKEIGDAYVTTVLFDNDYEVLHNHINITDIKPITNREYFARGTTALLDAIGRTINNVGKRLSDTPEDERPEKVVFVITTDGLENASKEFSQNTVRNMIIHQQDKYSWNFMFLGANMDAVSEAIKIGINGDFAKNYTANDIGTRSVYASVSKAMSCVRNSNMNMSMIDNDSYKAVVDALDEVE